MLVSEHKSVFISYSIHSESDAGLKNSDIGTMKTKEFLFQY